MKKSCFTELDLRNYALGASDDSTSEEIERHLAECPACEETLSGFDNSADTLMRHLPLAAGAPLESASVASDRPGWLEQLRGGPPGAAGRSSDPALAPSPLPFRALHELPAYELLGVLGHGGMGIVYRARHRQLNRVVAMKVLQPRLTAAVEARQRFEREIRILGSLHHPGVVMATDAGQIGSAAYLVMEFIDGVDLARLVKRSGPLSVAEACAVGRDMADALAAAHRAGAVHRDVKPSNVMIDRSGRVKLLDFGLAQLATLSTDDPETSLGQLLGTLEYMAPEQARPEGLVDSRVDLYGLGATMFFLLTGRSPRGTGARRSLLEQLRSLSEDQPCDVRALRPDVPVPLSELIAALLSRDPAGRPASAEVVAQAFSEWSGGNLAERVVDMAAMGDESQHPDSREEADRSLSRLLGIVPDEAPAAPGTVAEADVAVPTIASGKSTGRRIASLIALAACAAAIWFGVTIILETPNGTLRIESEVLGVRVEVLDEKDQARELTIDRNERETVLRAGQYRVRLAGEHDGLTISPTMITLRKGKAEVAKITRVPSETSHDHAHQETTAQAQVAIAERFFKGDPESVWQKRFDVEIDARAKIAAAEALATLATDLPPEKRIDRMISIGAALLEAGWGDDVLQVPLAGFVPTARQQGLAGGGFNSPRSGAGRRGRGGAARRPAPSVPAEVLPGGPISAFFLDGSRWHYSAALGSEWQGFLDLVDRDLAQIPATRLAENLGQRIATGRPAESAFAALLVGGKLNSYHFRQDVSAVARLVTQLNVDHRGIDQTALAVLLQAKFSDQAGVDAQLQITGAMNALASRLVDSPQGTARMRMIAAWLHAAPILDVDPKIHAVLAYERLAIDPRTGLAEDFLPKQFDAEYPYRAAERSQDDRLLAAYVSKANRRLAATGQDQRAIDAVIQSLNDPLRSRLPTDSWDVETTARLLTDRLRQFYAGDAAEEVDMPEPSTGIPGCPPVTPAMIITNIVRITGAIPDFAHAGPPAVAERLRLWKQLQASIDLNDGKKMERHRAALASLLEIAPYESLEVVLAPNVPSLYVMHRMYYIVNPNTRAAQQNGNAPLVDPLLLLAILADLCGHNDIQDEHFAKIIADSNPPGQMLTIALHLNDILTGPTAIKPIAHDLLQKIRMRSQNGKLREAVQKIDPQ
ncbi:MAG TPA: protein kinase [Planctomycetaceae bacterium]|jgi:serine/threonine protein kinase